LNLFISETIEPNVSVRSLFSFNQIMLTLTQNPIRNKPEATGYGSTVKYGWANWLSRMHAHIRVMILWEWF